MTKKSFKCGLCDKGTVKSEIQLGGTTVEVFDRCGNCNGEGLIYYDDTPTKLPKAFWVWVIILSFSFGGLLTVYLVDLLK